MKRGSSYPWEVWAQWSSDKVLDLFRISPGFCPHPLYNQSKINVREIAYRTGAVGIIPSADAYIIPVTSYLMEYAEDWSTSRIYLNNQTVQVVLQLAA